MLIDHGREKLIHAMIYFATHTHHCGKVKLFKLLYFLDFEHFRAVGRSVTGLRYFAWPKGPVPLDLQQELDNPSEDLAAAITISQIPVYQGSALMLSMDPVLPFSEEHFTKRELSLLASLAAEFANAKADEMIEATHLENQPWHRVFEQENNRQAEIPYEYALRADEYDEMVSHIKDRREFTEAIR
jgi:uncharacterized phage-associated protein